MYIYFMGFSKSRHAATKDLGNELVWLDLALIRLWLIIGSISRSSFWGRTLNCAPKAAPAIVLLP